VIQYMLMWWHNRLAARKAGGCDSCDGTFKAHELTPTSGDWWLCPKCLDALFADMKLMADVDRRIDANLAEADRRVAENTKKLTGKESL
jgi:hypothetical protein